MANTRVAVLLTSTWSVLIGKFFAPAALAANHLAKLACARDRAKQAISDKLLEHKQYISKYGDDMSEITDWQWGQASAGTKRRSSTEGDNV